MLERSLDRLGEILIRNQKLRTPLLLQALQEQEKSGELLGKILVQNGWVTEEDIEDALKHQGYQPLVDPQGVEVTPTPSQSDQDPQEILNHLMNLAAKKGASDIHIEPTPDEIAVKLRIDGLFYKVKPLEKSILAPLLGKLQEVFGLNASEPELPQRGRATAKMQDRDYDLMVQTLPTRQGVSVTIKLIDRRYFPEELHRARFQTGRAAPVDAGPGPTLWADYGDFSAVQRSDDDLVLVDGSPDQIRA